jgi:hypothetical protein
MKLCILCGHHKHPEAAAPAGCPVAARLAELKDGLSRLPARARGQARRFAGGKYKAFEKRYGRKGAIAVLSAVVLLAPVPAPGTSLLPLAIAEGLLWVGGRLTARGRPPAVATLAEAVLETVHDWYRAVGEEPPALGLKDAVGALEQLL